MDQISSSGHQLNCQTLHFIFTGIGAFWRGAMPFVNRAMLVGATQVGTYDQFKESYAAMGIKGKSNEFASSMSAGLLYSLITMPFESAKNRMAFQKKDANGQLPYRSTLQTFSKVVASEGILSLWKGFLPYYGSKKKKKRFVQISDLIW